jgi:hypothetical protein
LLDNEDNGAGHHSGRDHLEDKEEATTILDAIIVKDRGI